LPADVVHAKRYVVRGRVQGVGYRYFVVGAAEQLGVVGFVRNLSNGDVEVHAEADAVTLQVFKRELEHGPRMARVTEIIEKEIPPSDLYSTFIVRG